jgi:RNA-directed DNA polymerase
MTEAKPFNISRHLVWRAYQLVRTKGKASGVDDMTMEYFDEDLKGNLYKIWNRMSSGCYIPPAVKLVEIPKDSISTRKLGIPTISDRIAQTVVKLILEPEIEPCFHPDSYGYRPKRSALQAVEAAKSRCWKYKWVVDLDIKGFFDNLDHKLVMRALRKHTNCKWILLYIERWLKAPVVDREGKVHERTKGTPQGGVVSPLIANLFLHYALDQWMNQKFSDVVFERYADDIVIHVQTESEAKRLLEAIRARLDECHLELHPVKSKIVLCKQGHGMDYEHTSFDFLGFTFRPRESVTRTKIHFTGFQPAVSSKSMKKMRQVVRDWNLTSLCHCDLSDIAKLICPTVSGWIGYYRKFYRTEFNKILSYVNTEIAKWACRKFKRLHRSMRQARHWLTRLATRDPSLFPQWGLGLTSCSVGQ